AGIASGGPAASSRRGGPRVERRGRALPHGAGGAPRPRGERLEDAGAPGAARRHDGRRARRTHGAGAGVSDGDPGPPGARGLGPSPPRPGGRPPRGRDAGRSGGGRAGRGVLRRAPATPGGAVRAVFRRPTGVPRRVHGGDRGTPAGGDGGAAERLGGGRAMMLNFEVV